MKEVKKKKSIKRILDPDIVMITYKDKKEVKRELLHLAAEQGHGNLSIIIREAIENYLKRNWKKEAAA